MATIKGLQAELVANMYCQVMKKKGYAAGGMTVKYKVGGMVKGKTYGSVDNRKKK